MHRRPKTDKSPAVVEWRVSADVAHLDRMATEIFERFASNDPTPWDQAFETAAALLAANYRVGEAEVGLLGLLDRESTKMVLGAAIDLGTLDAAAAIEAQRGLVFTDPNEREE